MYKQPYELGWGISFSYGAHVILRLTYLIQTFYLFLKKNIAAVPVKAVVYLYVLTFPALGKLMIYSPPELSALLLLDTCECAG